MNHKKLMKTCGSLYGDCAYIYRNGILVRRQEHYKDKEVEFLYFSPFTVPLRVWVDRDEKAPVFQRIILSGGMATILRIGEIVEIEIWPFNGSENTRERGIGMVTTTFRFAQGTELTFSQFSSVPVSTDITVQGAPPFADCYSQEITGIYVPDYKTTMVEPEKGKTQEVAA